MRKVKYLLVLLLVFTLTPNIVRAADTNNNILEKLELIVPSITITTGNGTNKILITNFTEGVNYEVFRSTKQISGYVSIGKTSTSEFVDNKVNVGDTYYYFIQAINNDDSERADSNTVGKKVILNIPNVKVTSNNKTSLTVSWDTLEGATGYEVYRATSKKGKYKKIATTSNTSYINSKLTVGKTYYYKVRAYKKYTKKVYSSYSKVVSGTPKVSKPTVKAESYSYTQNQISWNKVSGASGYVIYRATTSNGSYKKIKSTKATSYVDNKLTVGVNYYYKVRAYTTVKKKNYNGDYSNVVVSSPKPATPKVNIISARDSLTIKIDKVAGATGYKIYKLNNDNYELIKTTAELSYKDTVVTYGSKYSYKVIAYQNVGDKTYESSEVVVSSTVKPAKLVLTNELLEYNINVIGAPIPEGTTEDDIVISIYKKVGNEDYKEIAKTNYKDGSDLPKNVANMAELETYYKKIIVNKNEDEVKTFMYIDDNLKLGETYKYKVKVSINGVESDFSNEIVSKIIIAKPKISGYKSAYNKVTVGITEKVSGAEGFEIHRATSKNGKYTKVYDGTNSYANVTSTYNKNLYYKIRAYKIVNGKKVYSEFSNVIKLKSNVSSLSTFPVKLTGEYGDCSIKSVSISKKRTTSSDVYYKFKINFKYFYSMNNNRSTMTVKFYNGQGNLVYTYRLSMSVKKGNKKNFSTSFDIKIPVTAVYYSFS